MWIVRLALRRMYTFVVMALAIALLGGLAIVRTPTDVFPDIDIPVISVVWRYQNLSATDMEQQITTFSEFATSFAVANIKNIESSTVDGIAVIRFSMHPGTNIVEAQAQITAASQTILGRMPPGTVPPLILRYNASSVPIIQLSITGDTLSDADLYDFGIYRVRQQLAQVQGTTLSLPYGGAPRQIMVDLEPEALAGYGLSPQDVNQAITAQNMTLPTGTAKMGSRDYTVGLNSSPISVRDLNDVPVRQINGKTIYIRDIANVRDGPAVQTSLVRQNGKRAVLVTILKNGNTSTLEIARRVKELLPTMRASAPPGVNIEVVSDQSPFVWAAVKGVLVEGLIAGALTGLMILLFLGSLRSTVIVMTSIPLSILISIIMLSALGQTINLMTLSGLALAVGILVDDATVEIENVHRNLAMGGKSLTRAILDGAHQIAAPSFVATTAIAIVFLSVVFLEGVPRYMFVPLAMAVAFSVLSSYFLSRTVVPTMMMYLLPGELAQGHGHGRGVFTRIHGLFNRGFDAMRDVYVSALEWALRHRIVVFVASAIFAAVSASLVPLVGRDFYPSVDTGELRLQATAPPGTRLEETARYFGRVEEVVRGVIPPRDLKSVTHNIGVPDGINLGITESATISTADGEMLISLNEEHHGQGREYMRKLRKELPARFPNMRFAFKPADMSTQILNFGLPAPIDVQVTGFDRDATGKAARTIADRLREVPGAVDVRIHQVTDGPRLHLEVDRERAAEAGLTQRDVANSVLVSLASSQIVNPNYWTDVRTTINYPVAVQTPQHRVRSINDLQTTTVAVPGGGQPQLLGDLMRVQRTTAPVVATHNNIQPTFNVRADVQGTDLGSVADELEKIVAQVRTDLPPGSEIVIRGQIDSMNSAFSRLGLGVLFAAVLVYFLMVVNFQSWIDPFVILTALPGALAGIVWMLFVTRTTFSVPSLMGAIMTVGVATSNSILMVVFANEKRAEGLDARAAAREAGFTRLRPVVMTALAMIIGMLPMSLGLSEGGEQTAPLGRAVIGGLLVATVATLFFVPVVYTVLRAKPHEERYDPDLDAPIQ
jgi:CzcA family heavy metal efflux pump